MHGRRHRCTIQGYSWRHRHGTEHKPDHSTEIGDADEWQDYLWCAKLEIAGSFAALVAEVGLDVDTHFSGIAI